MIQDSHAIKATQMWISRFVVGYQLCPFAKPVVDAGQIRYGESEAKFIADLLDDVSHEIQFLLDAKPTDVETSFLIFPRMLEDFFAYNDFLDAVDLTIQKMGLEGIIQVASFHPDYQFANTSFDDVSNATNRSPYPMLHLLREESLERALETFPAPETIPERNMKCMEKLGAEAIREILEECLEVGDAEARDN